MSQIRTSVVYRSAIACLLIALLVTSYLKYWISVDEDPQPELKIPQGKLRGVNIVTRHNRKIFGFKGIPFAQPPVGNLRFKEAVPAGAWHGTFDASHDSVDCPQIEVDVDNGSVIGDENCLYLNVYTPRLPTGDNSMSLPVMVYVFGGAFLFGTNNSTLWGPHFILDKDVVLVVPSYRVGVPGFLSTGDEEVPGNNGLKDIVLSLKWTRDNIQYFGGDPDQVTFFGSSSGAVAVHILTLSNATNGLFHRYITQSGSALMPFTRQPKTTYANHAKRLGQYLGCPTNASRVLIDCLRSFNTSQLIETDPLFRVWREYPAIHWGPTVEPDLEGALITDSIASLYAAGKIRDLPWITTVVRDEGIIDSILFYRNLDIFEEFLDKIDFLLPHILDYVNSVDDVTAYTAALKSYYLTDLTADRNILLDNVTRLFGDALFHYPAYRGFQQHSIFAKNPQYFYSFEYRGTVSYTSIFGRGTNVNYGVAHCDELVYLFNELTFYDPTKSEIIDSDSNMADILVQLWTSFATTGIPTIPEVHSATIWQPFSSRKNYLQIGNGPEVSLKVKYDFLKERMQFWNELTAATSWK